MLPSENLVNEIVDFLNPEEVVYMGGEEENITFNLQLNYVRSIYLQINLLSQLSGALEAEGIAVVIDVFRCFTTQAIAFQMALK